MSKYKVIFFDWNLTLSMSRFWQQLEHIEHPHHDWHQRIIDVLFSKKKMISQWMRGDIDVSEVVNYISNKTGYNKNNIKNYLIESCEQMQLVDSSILDLVKKLRSKGIFCVIATDNMDVFSLYTVPALKLDNYFDDIINSFDKKILKYDFVNNDSSDISFFNDYLKNKDISYDQAVLIDDSPDESGLYKKNGFDIKLVKDKNDIISFLQKMIKNEI